VLWQQRSSGRDDCFPRKEETGFHGKVKILPGELSERLTKSGSGDW
jgi:hypothetical protein